MSEAIEYLDEEIASFGGHRTRLHCDECDSSFEVSADIANEMTILKAHAGDPIVCPVCYDVAEVNFLKAVHIDKEATHCRCPECGDLLLGMTGGYVFTMSVSLLGQIDADRLPVNFDPDALPLLMCRECRLKVSLAVSEY